MFQRSAGFRRVPHPFKGGEAAVRFGLSLPTMSIRLDHHEQDVPAPAIDEGLLHIPKTVGQVFDLLHEDDVMEPGNGPENR